MGYIVRMRTVGQKFGRICWAHGKAAKQNLDAFCDNIVSDCWEPAGQQSVAGATVRWCTKIYTKVVKLEHAEKVSKKTALMERGR